MLPKLYIYLIIKTPLVLRKMKRKVFEININYFDFNNNITQSGFLNSSGFRGRETLESRQGNLKNCNFLNYRRRTYIIEKLQIWRKHPNE